MTDTGKIVVTIDEELEDLIPNYLTNKQKDIEMMRQALAEKDYEKVQLIGHSMKGSGGGYGFEEISEIGRTIEEAAINNDADDVERHIQRLDDYLERVEVVYE